MLDFVIFAVTALVGLLVVLLLLFRKPNARKANDLGIPGDVASDSERGNFSDIAKAGSLHEYLCNLHAEHGPLAAFWWGETLTVSAASPQLFKALSSYFNRPVELFLLFEPLITRLSIQYANDDEGKERHKRLRASFQGEGLYQYYKTFNNIVQEYIQSYGKLAADERICINSEMLVFAMHAIARTSFGEIFEDPAEMEQLRVAYNACWGEMERRVDGLPPGDEREEIFKKNREVMYQLVRRAIAKRHTSNMAENRLMFIDNLMSMDISEEQILADSVSFLVGGFHTTGNLLTWALYYLGCHPDVQNRVADEALRVLGKTGPVTAENISKLEYTQQVVDESLRCSVLAPWAAKYVNEDITLSVGDESYKIPAETPIITALGVVLQDPVIWPDPEKFDPERFNSEASSRRHPRAFEAFGLPARRCPGFQFANAEARIALALLCRQFRFELVPGAPVSKVHGLVTHPNRDIEMTVEKRKL